MAQAAEDGLVLSADVTQNDDDAACRAAIEAWASNHPAGCDTGIARLELSAALLTAADAGAIRVCGVLLGEQGTDINYSDPGPAHERLGQTALFKAAWRGHVALVAFLLRHPDVAVNQAERVGKTPLYRASAYGHAEVVSLLLAHPRIRVNQGNAEGTTPLFIACQEGHANVVALLLARADTDANLADEGATPLFMACQNGHAEVVRQLLAHGGLDTAQTANDRSTPLVIACHQGRVEVVRLLLAHGSSELNVGNQNEATPLFAACQAKMAEVVRLLLDQGGIAVNQPNRRGGTPLFMACQSNDPGLVRQLLAHPGVDVNASMEDGTTPLFYACQEGFAEVVALLLGHGSIRVNKAITVPEQDAHPPDQLLGWTALHTASEQGHAGIIGQLLVRGACRFQPANDGSTPRELVLGDDGLARRAFDAGPDYWKRRLHRGHAPSMRRCLLVVMLIQNRWDGQRSAEDAAGADSAVGEPQGQGGAVAAYLWLPWEMCFYVCTFLRSADYCLEPPNANANANANANTDANANANEGATHGVE